MEVTWNTRGEEYRSDQPLPLLLSSSPPLLPSSYSPFLLPSSLLSSLFLSSSQFVLEWTKLVVFLATLVTIGTALALGSTLKVW